MELQQRADAMRDRQAQAELEASVWRNAHSAASARALGLESEKGQLAAALHAEKARADAQQAARERESLEKDLLLKQEAVDALTKRETEHRGKSQDTIEAPRLFSPIRFPC